MDTIKSDIKKFFENTCGLDFSEIKDDIPLFTTSIVDSLDVFSLISYLETTFKIKLQAFELSLEKLDSINLIAALVMDKMK